MTEAVFRASALLASADRKDLRRQAPPGWPGGSIGQNSKDAFPFGLGGAGAAIPSAIQEDGRSASGLQTGVQAGVHEVCEAAYGDMPAATGFALAAAFSASRKRSSGGAIIWISQQRLARAHGLPFEMGLPFETGLPPFTHKIPLIAVRAPRRRDVLWAAEEALRADGAALVIAETEDLDFTESRRLQLAAARGGAPAILLVPYARAGASAAQGRWRVAAAPSAPNPVDERAPGRPRWRVSLDRARLAPSEAGRTYDVEYKDETLSLNLVAGLASDATRPRDARADNQPDGQDGNGGALLNFRRAG